MRPVHCRVGPPARACVPARLPAGLAPARLPRARPRLRAGLVPARLRADLSPVRLRVGLCLRAWAPTHLVSPERS